jgi:hypothetical protein
MRRFLLGLVLSLAVLLPKMGNAQVYQFRTSYPTVTAAGALWQINSEPVIVGSLLYLPTREIRMFDGQVMAQVGIYQGVPVYADTTLEPYSKLYVPVGRDGVRAYERRRDGELAGTTGSRVPTFPVEISSAHEASELFIGTAGTVVPAPAVESARPPDRIRARRTIVETIPRPTASRGVWLEFNGARWYADGPAATFSADRFEPIGEHRGFPVYREKAGGKNEIWVSVVKDGPLAPFSKR